MADKRCGIEFERIEQAVDVGDQLLDAVVADVLRDIRMAVAALIRCNGTKPCISQRRQLVAPGIGQFRKSVQQDDGRALALFVDRQIDTVRAEDGWFGEHQ